MSEYHKINTIFKRDLRGNIMHGDYSLPVFEYLKDNEWVFTEKVDGTNIRVIWEPSQSIPLRYGGRTDNASIPVFLLDRLNDIFMASHAVGVLGAKFKDGVCLYGEGYGAKIQKGGGNYKADGQDFVLFDVKIGRWWLERQDVEEIAASLGIDVVPIRLRGTLAAACDMVRDGHDSAWGRFTAEGLVGRPAVEIKTRNGDRVITKIKHRDFAKVSK